MHPPGTAGVRFTSGLAAAGVGHGDAAPVLSERGVNVFVIADLLASEAIDPLDTAEDDIRCCS
jgi:hypothetical protein